MWTELLARSKSRVVRSTEFRVVFRVAVAEEEKVDDRRQGSLLFTENQ